MGLLSGLSVVAHYVEPAL